MELKYLPTTTQISVENFRQDPPPVYCLSHPLLLKILTQKGERGISDCIWPSVLDSLPLVSLKQ